MKYSLRHGALALCWRRGFQANDTVADHKEDFPDCRTLRTDHLNHDALAACCIALSSYVAIPL
eukprot:2776407-Pyramimonas_sp.AAC.1